MKKFKIKNFWRTAFFILLGILMIFLTVIFTKVMSTPEIEDPTDTVVLKEGEPAFLVELTKEQLNQLIQTYLKEHQDYQEVNYMFLLEKEAVLKGNLEIVGFEVDYHLYFEPEVLENGNVLLKAKSISLGTLSLPVSTVMDLLADKIEMPSWININSAEEALILHLDQFVLQDGISFKAKKIDLQEDSIQIDVYMN